VDENHQLSETFRVPDLKTGRMVRLITQLTSKEEEMFRNMIRRMNNLCKVSHKYCCCICLFSSGVIIEVAVTDTNEHISFLTLSHFC